MADRRYGLRVRAGSWVFGRKGLSSEGVVHLEAAYQNRANLAAVLRHFLASASVLDARKALRALTMAWRLSRRRRVWRYQSCGLMV